MASRQPSRPHIFWTSMASLNQNYTIEKSNIQVEVKDFSTELKETLEETFEEVLMDVKDALSIEAKPEANKTLKLTIEEINKRKNLLLNQIKI